MSDVIYLVRKSDGWGESSAWTVYAVPVVKRTEKYIYVPGGRATHHRMRVPQGKKNIFTDRDAARQYAEEQRAASIETLRKELATEKATAVRFDDSAVTGSGDER